MHGRQELHEGARRCLTGAPMQAARKELVALTDGAAHVQPAELHGDEHAGEQYADERKRMPSIKMSFLMNGCIGTVCIPGIKRLSHLF